MDLDSAIASHTQWKARFRTAIAQREQVDAAAIAKDDCCALGMWLHGEGQQRFGRKPEFVALVGKHQRFHVEAGKVAQSINAALYAQAEKMIDAGTAFCETSNATILAISAVQKSVWMK